MNEVRKELWYNVVLKRINEGKLIGVPNVFGEFVIAALNQNPKVELLYRWPLTVKELDQLKNDLGIDATFHGCFSGHGSIYSIKVIGE